MLLFLAYWTLGISLGGRALLLLAFLNGPLWGVVVISGGRKTRTSSGRGSSQPSDGSAAAGDPEGREE
jgi:hypothetical protein